jgi:hypothetical protein
MFLEYLSGTSKAFGAAALDSIFSIVFEEI